MDWTDTLMLDSNRHRSSFEGLQENRFEEDLKVDSIKAVSARVLAVQGVAFVHATGREPDELAAALAILRGFRATGRRVVLCDTSMLAPGRQNGRSLVEKGGAQAVVSCGMHGRDLAIGARDAGLDLGSVVVCRDIKSACEALVSQLGPGDTVLLWGIDQETSNRLVNWLEKHFAENVRLAA